MTVNKTLYEKIFVLKKSKNCFPNDRNKVFLLSNVCFFICCQCIYSIWRHLTKVYGSRFLTLYCEGTTTCKPLLKVSRTNKKTHIRGKKTLFLLFAKQFFNFFKNKYFPIQSLIANSQASEDARPASIVPMHVYKAGRKNLDLDVR